MPTQGLADCSRQAKALQRDEHQKQMIAMKRELSGRAEDAGVLQLQQHKLKKCLLLAAARTEIKLCVCAVSTLSVYTRLR